MKKYLNIFYIIVGSLAVALGVVGIFVPLLPTTPFLLLAAACYIRGSEKLYKKLINHPVLGKYIRDYREKKEIPLHAKIIGISLMWLSMGYSILFILQNVFIQILLFVIAICVTIHLLSLKTAGQQ